MPGREKTGLLGFRPGLTQTGLYSHRKRLEALDFGFKKRKNKGADQLRGYREADLRLCFRLCRSLIFPCRGSVCILKVDLYRCHENYSGPKVIYYTALIS